MQAHLLPALAVATLGAGACTSDASRDYATKDLLVDFAVSTIGNGVSRAQALFKPDSASKTRITLTGGDRVVASTAGADAVLAPFYDELSELAYEATLPGDEAGRAFTF